MKLTSSLLLSAALLGFMACSDAEKSNTQGTLNVAPATTQSGAPAAGTSVALNPAHGMPGHRCDIEVGAPLNSAPAPNLPMPNLQPLPTPGTQTVQPVQSAQPVQTGTVAPGTNPPHGQPGHDCAVPVGAPLNK